MLIMITKCVSWGYLAYLCIWTETSFFLCVRMVASVRVNAGDPNRDEESNWDTVLTTQAVL